MTPADFLVPTYVQMLTALAGWLDKAQAQAQAPEQADALLSARLAPDMFPLSTQVRFACVQAQEGLFRLRDEAFPPGLTELLDEGRNAGEAPGTMAQARTRIAETLSLVRSLSGDLDGGGPDRAVAHELPTGMIFDLTLDQYVRDWAIGQFYFHVMTAYAILRHRGIELGKADYVAHMFAYLRPGTAPQG